MKLDWRLFALGSALFAALTAVLAKIGVAGVNSSFATFYRTAVVLLLSGLVVWRGGEWQPLAAISARSLVFLTLSGLATGLSWLCYFKALQLGPASRVAPIDKLSVVLVVLIAAVFLHEPLNWKTALGSLLIAAGAIVMAV
jgi:transporter family protein